MRGYLTPEAPPLDWVTSVRSVVLRDGLVLLAHNLDGYHVLPGGRREAGESLEDTLRREVLEETGWSVRVGRRLGFIVLHHLAPRRPEYLWPYPDFVQVVYRSEAVEHRPGATDPDGYELGAELVAPERALSRGFSDLSDVNRLFLEAALTV